METYRDPFWFETCPRCRAHTEQPCRALINQRGGIGEPIERIHPERPRKLDAPPLRQGRQVDEEITERRLRVWYRRARLGDLVEDIAAELGLKRSALDRFVVRARERGNPLAVYHAASRPPHLTHCKTENARTRHDRRPEPHDEGASAP